jgi:hypothetical protein
VQREELIELLTPQNLRLLNSLPPYGPQTDVIKTVENLRKTGHSPGVVASVVTQLRLRTRAQEKFGVFASSMLFTEAGLEQATRLRVAAIHAGRFEAAGMQRIADLGCGIGADSMAMAALDREVLAVEADEVTAILASFNLAPFPSAHVEHTDAKTVDLSRVDAAYFDPARRSVGHSHTQRLSNPNDYTPSLSFVFTVAQKMPVGVKLGPGFDRGLIPETAEAQWVSVDGHVVEMGLWFGALARNGVRRSALVLDRGGVAEMNAPHDSENAELGPLADYLYEPHGAVIRARLIGNLARDLDAHMLSEGIAYFTSNELQPTRFATGFRIIEELPFDERRLSRALRERDIGTVEIKKRGVPLDPAQLRKRLALRGNQSGTVVLTRIAGKHTALLVERVTESLM